MRIAGIVAMLALVVARPALGQPATLDGVVVTGSHLRGVDLESALPVQVITREEIERSGVTTAEQLLARVPANVNAFNTALTVGENIRPGLSSANLRGLGGGSTLVLLNGRRLANYAFDGASVDLNSIPLAAIDRIEILKDGASAIYGADAIAGVINVILRKDFTGVALGAEAAATQHGGGNERQFHFVGGAGDLARDGHNVVATVIYQKQQRLPARERDFARTALRPDIGLDALPGLAFPANIIDRPGLRVLNPAAASGCAPPSSVTSPVTLPFRSPACATDAAHWRDALPEVERASAMLRGAWRASAQLDVYAEALIGRNRFEAQLPPGSSNPPVTRFGQPMYPAGGPHYPTEFAALTGLTGPLLVAYTVDELGPRLNTTRSDAQRYAVGAEGKLGGWSVDAAMVHSSNRQELAYDGSWLTIRGINQVLATGLVDPWGQATPAGRALLESVIYRGTLQTADAEATLFNAFASRPLAQLPSGPLLLALGAEARREALAYHWDSRVLRGDSPLGLVEQSKGRSRRVSAVSAELGVPVLPGLGMQLAVRGDEYSDFGTSVNPKIALRWQALRDLVLRASWARGFRAPPLYSLVEPLPESEAVAGWPDPVRCPVTRVVTDCFIRLQATAGGNPNLQPETSRQWSAGLVWEPAPGLSVVVDYWDIEQDGIIEPLDVANLLRFHTRFPARIKRGPVDPAFPSLPGPIIDLDLSAINLGMTHTAGVDLALQWAAARGPWGSVRAVAQGTYTLRYDTQIDGESFVSRLGSAIYGDPIPRWRSTLALDWSGRDWAATLANTYTHGYIDQQIGPDGLPRRVAADSIWDLQVRYAGFTRTALAVGIRNLFDSDPPSSNQNRASASGYNPQLSSPLGRTYYLRLSVAFD